MMACRGALAVFRDSPYPGFNPSGDIRDGVGLQKGPAMTFNSDSIRWSRIYSSEAARLRNAKRSFAAA